MDNVYSLFYTGQQNPYGIGTWDSRKIKHSSSQPFLTNNIKTISSKKSNDKIKLPIIMTKTSHKNHSKKDKNKYTTNSSMSSSSQYDVTKNRKELSNYVKDINNSIAARLQNDNFIAQQKLNNIKNNYNEIKSLLNNKIDKLEQDQQMQFMNLKHALEQGGGLKMMGAVRNADEDNNYYDLNRAEEEDMIDATRKLPKILEDKINMINDMKKREKQDEKRLLSQVRKKVNDEIRKQKEKDEMRFRKEINDIEQKRENIRKERRRLMEELQHNDSEESMSYLSSYQYPPNVYTQSQPPPQPHPQMMAPYPVSYPPQIYAPPMNNNNNSNTDSTNEFLKIFLLKKLFDDKPSVVQTPAPAPPQYIPTPVYPQPAPIPQPQQPISYPQPIFYQNPPQVVSPPNVIIQQERAQPQPQIQHQQQPQPQPQPNNVVQYKDIVITKSETINSDKGIPFIDPLEEYLRETKSKKKSTSKKKSERQKASKKDKTKEKEEEEEEESVPSVKLKLYDPDKNKSKVIHPESKKSKTKSKSKSKTKSKKSEKSKKSKKKETKSQKETKKKSEPKKTKDKKKKEEKKEEEEEEEDEEEEEEEDDEEEEEEEDDDEEPEKGK